MLLGVALTTMGVFLVTFARFCMNLRNKQRLNLNDHNKYLNSNLNIGKNNQHSKNQLANFKRGHTHNPSQGSGKFLLDSEDSSRHHSRNSSTGSTFVNVTNETNTETATTVMVNANPEAERLLTTNRPTTTNNDQRSAE